MIKCLVFSSGTYEIFLQISGLKSLIDNKKINLEEIECYYGTSAGSLIAVLCCIGIEYDVIYNYIVERPWHKLLNIDAEKIINSYQNCGVFDKNVFTEGFKPLFKLAELSIDINLYDFYLKTKKKLNIFSTNTTDFSIKNFNYETDPELSLIDAIYMSCSIPIIFKPMKYKNSIFNDGALLCRFPINEAILSGKYTEKEIIGITIDNRFSVNIGISDKNLFEYVTSYLTNYIEKKVLVTDIVNNNINILNIERRNNTESYGYKLLSDIEFRKESMLLVEKDYNLFVEKL